MNRLSFALVLAALLSTGLAHAQQGQKTFQCWTDKNGQRMCGDRVPPEYASQERKVINQRGMVVETKKGAKTAEEIAAEERKVKETEEAKKRADYDRSLLEAYRNVKDIEVARDERLAMLDGRIKGAEKSVADNEKTLLDLRARADEAHKSQAKPQEGSAENNEAKPADEKLTKQIRQYEKSLADSQKSLERLTQEREQTQKKYDQDLQRYKELRPPAPVAEKKPAS